MPTVTISGNTYEVYDTMANVDIYHDGNLFENTWQEQTDDVKLRAIVTASRLLNQMTWQGAPVDIITPQPLAWPRSGVVDRNGNAVSSASIPTDVLNGFAELALALVVDPDLLNATNTGSNTKRVKAGDVEAEFFRPTAGQQWPASVMRYLQLYASGPVSGAGVMSGSEAVSIFETGTELYGKTQGYA